MPAPHVSALHAEEASVTSGAIRGRLTSSDSVALPGVTITVESPALQGTRTVASDVNGNFTVPGLPAGD